MENQHVLIKGYRDLSQPEIDLMNEAKTLAANVGDFIEKLQGDRTSLDGPDQRWVAIAKTELQGGFMSLVRSIAKPTSF